MGKENDLSTRERVWQTVLEIASTQQAFTRIEVQRLSGLTFHVVDDHMERLEEDGKVKRVRAGTFILVKQFPAPVPVSYTPILEQLMMKMERGDSIWEMTWPELRLHAQMLAGFLAQMNRMANEEELTDAIARITRELQHARQKQHHTDRAMARLARQVTTPQLTLPWEDPKKPKPKRARPDPATESLETS